MRQLNASPWRWLGRIPAANASCCPARRPRRAGLGGSRLDTNGQWQQQVAEARRCAPIGRARHGKSPPQCDPVVLQAGIGAKARTAALARLQPEPGQLPLLAVATGFYIGEGFGCPTLDTTVPRRAHLF
jgi:hypothetical protein